ncbi:hypothetical protein JKP88DRAFT_220700 [Tribonema minus]|uniref:Uncharacterized protein n=1 Tax=Tribonema minus TaxID=303371 RepID=A0A836CEH6_9STRA|nr:hypothetical protein JKP88DRAFT_220700 [Tribonema minus]
MDKAIVKQEQRSEDVQVVTATALPSVGTDVVLGAGGAGAVAGYMLGGPLLAVGLGVAGAGVAATQPQGTRSGDFARGAGQLAVNGFHAARDVERKHQVIDRFKAAGTQGFARAQQLNEEHKLLERGKASAADLWTKAKQVNEQHRLVERGQAGAAELWGKAKQVNKEHKLLERGQASAAQLLQRARQLDEQHALSERAGRAIAGTVQRANVAMLEGAAVPLTQELPAENYKSKGV